MKKYGMLGALLVSYADRLAAFLMPLMMLRGISGPDVYVRIEYIISVSIIVSTFCDAGLRNYVLNHFGQHRDAARTTLLTARAAILIVLGQTVLLMVSVAVVRLVIPPGTTNADLPLGILRGIALSMVGLATQLFIIHEHPLAGILLSLASWLIGGIAFLLPAGVSPDLRVIVFFSASFLIILATPVLLWRTTGLRPGREGLDYVLDAVSWGWPLLLAAASSVAVTNAARIFGFSSFAMQEAVSFAFWVRIFSVVHLSHRASITIVSRKVFVSNVRRISPEVRRTYLQMVLPTIAACFAAAACTPLVNSVLDFTLPQLPLSVIVMIGLQVSFWCFASFLELPLARNGCVNVVLVASAVPASAFMLFLLLMPEMSLQRVTNAMALASVVQFAILYSQTRKMG